jgi:hypothetical protein
MQKDNIKTVSQIIAGLIVESVVVIYKVILLLAAIKILRS